MSFSRYFSAWVVFSSLCLITGQARASCGSATCPVDTRSALDIARHQWRVSYEFEYLDQDQPRVGAHRASVGEISQHHDEVRTINRIHRVAGSWGVTDRFAVDLALPWVSRSHRHIHHHHGEDLTEGWDFSSVGDLAVQGRYAFFKPQGALPTLSIIAGAEFPTGKSLVTNEDGDDAEPGITPGSGSYDVIGGISSLQRLSVPTFQGTYGVMPLFLSITYKVNGKGHEDYRQGDMLSIHSGATYPLFYRIGVIAQLNYLLKGKDHVGETTEDPEFTGGEFLYVSPGLQVTVWPGVDWSTIVQVPVHQRVNNIQLTSDYNLLSTVSYRFSL